MKKTWYDRAKSRSVESGDCILHTTSLDRDGYARVSSVGKVKYLHRLSYERDNGEIPDGLVVRHTCDTPNCWNPDHLILGTQKENVWDAINRGRQNTSRGSELPQSKLSESEVLEIREGLSNGVTQDKLSKRYSISQSQISEIKTGKQWKHVT